jgi:Mn2+/Fe2+ NRAMP family transporter
MASTSEKPIGHVARLLMVVGPGIVVAGSVMGSGELINTPIQAAKFGFVLLWAALVSCVIKFFLQVEIGRHCLVHGRTTHQAINTLPGPKWRNTSYLGIIYMSGYLIGTLTGPGIIGALAGMMHREIRLNASERISTAMWGVMLVALALALLWHGAYRNLEYLVAVLVGVFSITVAIGLFLIQGTEYHISREEIMSGLTFSLGDMRRDAAFAVISLMGALGTSANELFMYPYWLLEKRRELGDPNDPDWPQKVRRWIHMIRIDVFVSTALATVMTAAFFLLGCAILHRQGIEPQGNGVIESISQVYTESFGLWSRWVFLVGAFCTLFSTVVVVAAASGRMFTDFFASLGWIERDDDRVVRRSHRLVQSTWLLGVLTVFLLFPQQPAKLIIFAQAWVAIFSGPLLIFAICWMAFHTDRRVRMGKLSAALLVGTSVVLVVCVMGGLVVRFLP